MAGALGRVSEHLLSARYRSEQLAAQMAVRLARWMLTPEIAAPDTFADAIVAYRADGAWVDRALAVLWDGSADQATSTAFSALVQKVRDRRDASECALAPLISGQPIDRPDVIGIELVLDRVVLPIAAAQPALVIVLDGMSAAVASELDADIVREGWAELVPAASPARLSRLFRRSRGFRAPRCLAARSPPGGKPSRRRLLPAAGACCFTKTSCGRVQATRCPTR